MSEPPPPVAVTDLLHPAHLVYISNLRINTLPYLLQCLDACDAEVRDHALYQIYMMVIQPRRRQPVNLQETPRDLLLDEVDYPAFRRKCEQLVESGVLDGPSLVLLVVNTALQAAFGRGNTTAVDQKITDARRHIAFIEGNRDLLVERGMSKATQNAMIKMQERSLWELPETTRQAYGEYVAFCEQVVARLLDEEIPMQRGTRGVGLG